MPEYLDDPSVLTKDELKSQLLAHSVELPSGSPVKDVYVQLYLEKLTAQKKRGTDVTVDAFSSDEELPPPQISSRGRSSGRKATRKTDKALPDELDVTVLSDQGLRDELFRHGVNVGPVVASTRKVYENKLLKLPEPHLLLTELDLPEMQVNHNSSSESDLYSDKEEEVPEPEFVAETEPAPVVERLLRSRGKTTRISSSQHDTVERIAKKVVQNDAPKELFPNGFNTAGLVATCRPPIKGAADRPARSIDLCKDENVLFSAKASKTTSSSSFYTESCSVNRVTSLPPSSSLNFSASSFATSSSRCLSAAPPAAQTKAAPCNMSLWMKIFLMAILAAFLFIIYQAMETNSVNPFAAT